jgi:hypothetical protein
MKKILFILLLYDGNIKAQDSLWITNLQLKAGTIKILAGFAIKSEDTTMVRSYQKWRAQFIANNPNDNANVTIDSSRTVNVVAMYSYLLRLPAGLGDIEDFVSDFRTSITSKRNTNSFLDALCDQLEAQYISELTTIKAVGGQILK